MRKLAKRYMWNRLSSTNLKNWSISVCSHRSLSNAGFSRDQKSGFDNSIDSQANAGFSWTRWYVVRRKLTRSAVVDPVWLINVSRNGWWLPMRNSLRAWSRVKSRADGIRSNFPLAPRLQTLQESTRFQMPSTLMPMFFCLSLWGKKWSTSTFIPAPMSVKSEKQ